MVRFPWGKRCTNTNALSVDGSLANAAKTTRTRRPSSPRTANRAAALYTINFGMKVARPLGAYSPDWLTLKPGEHWLAKLVRIGRNPRSLLMRVDMKGMHHATYVFGKDLHKIEVKTLNCTGWPR